MKLDPQVKALLDEVNAVEAASVWDTPVNDVRAGFDQLFATFAAPGPEVGKVENRTIPGPYRPIPIRIYRPAGASPDKPLPVYVNFHGSGYVVFSIDTYDHICRILCRDADCIVVAVDYCKAPEFKFPKPVEEAWASTLWVFDHAAEFGGDAARIAIGGDSAGGGLAAVVTQRAKKSGNPKIAFQLLVYPVTDTREDTQSYKDFAEGYMLTADTMHWFFQCYFNTEAERATLDAAPLRNPDLRGLPPATIIAAGHDPLFSEGIAYAERLKAAGVPTEYVNYEGGIHGFWSATGKFGITTEALKTASTALRRAFATH